MPEMCLWLSSGTFMLVETSSGGDDILFPHTAVKKKKINTPSTVTVLKRWDKILKYWDKIVLKKIMIKLH